MRIAIDHVVVNVRTGLDEAQHQWQALGFRLTPRGHHSLGSSNHLAVFADDYIELLGIEPGRTATRRELIDHPLGLTGLALKPENDGFAAELRHAGVAMGEAREFHRPVELPNGEAPEARFRTAEVADDRVRNGRIFVCHHYTPELVWRDEWRGHPNGAVGLAEFVFRSANPAGLAELFASMGAAPAAATAGGYVVPAGPAIISVLTAQAVADRFGDAAPGGGDDRMVALGVKVHDVATAARMAGVQVANGTALVPHDAACGVVLAYVPAG